MKATFNRISTIFASPNKTEINELAKYLKSIKFDISTRTEIHPETEVKIYCISVPYYQFVEALDKGLKYSVENDFVDIIRFQSLADELNQNSKPLPLSF